MNDELLSQIFQDVEDLNTTIKAEIKKKRENKVLIIPSERDINVTTVLEMLNSTELDNTQEHLCTQIADTVSLREFQANLLYQQNELKKYVK